MTVYWVLLLITAFIAYVFGSFDSIVLASNFVFRRSLMRLGKDNVWISNFRRIYGIRGAIKLFLVEAVKNLLPILIGGWLLGIKEHDIVGRAFAGFCLVLGRLYPVFYRFKGTHGIIAMVFAALCVDMSVGAAVAFMAGAVIWFLRYVSLGAIVGAFTLILASLLVLDDSLAMMLCIFIGVLVLFKHIPAATRLFAGKEARLSFEEDISYKFDQKF